MATQKTFTKKQINDQIESVLADNTSQDISAADVRSVVKDYMTGSMSAPLLIYAGQITSGDNAAACVVRDQYYNPDFFQKQSGNPLDTNNIFSLDSISMIGKADGDYTRSVSGGEGLIKYTVLSNVITSLSIEVPPVGMIIGDNFLLESGFTNTVTYNGVIRPKDASGSVSETYFELTENTDNTYEKHRNVNTVISATNRIASTGASSSLSFSHNEKNEILHGYADSLAIFKSKTVTISSVTNPPQTTTSYRTQHIQLYRLPGTEESRSEFSN